MSNRISANWTRTLAVLAVAASGLCAGTALAADTVNVRYSWKLKGEYMAFYMAKEKGYFAKEGIDAKLGEGAGAQAALGSLIQGNEDVVVLPGIYAITAISKGMPIKMIALYHPVAPVGFLSNPENPVRVPKDLEGKSVSTAAGDTTVEYLPVLCSKAKIDCTKIKRVRGDMGMRVSQLQAKQVDLASTYLNVDPPMLEAQNLRFVIFDAAKFGLTVPGLALVSTDKAIQSKGDVLRRFIRAVNRGFESSRSDPTAAAEALLKSWSGGPPLTVVTEQVKKTLEFTPVATKEPLGYIDPAVVRSAVEEMALVNPQDASTKPLSDYYTNVLLAPAKN
jgi:NitT/TauT family transport system substrate-binding protein